MTHTAAPQHLEQVRSLLEAGKVEDALHYLDSSCNGKDVFHNARAVCHLRLGDSRKAIDVLRQIVYPNGADKPPCDQPLFQANLAAALLAGRRMVACQMVLRQIKNRSHPAVVQVQSALDGWKKTLGLAERVIFWIGLDPGPACELGPNPGTI